MPKQEKKKVEKSEKYHYSLGRRKTASATVRLFESKGENIINGKKLAEFTNSEMEQTDLVEPFIIADLDPSKYHFTVKVNGGGHNGQIGAIRLAISRALIKMNPELRKSLKPKGLLTRDPRMKERKHTGRRKARKSEQFSKR